MNITEKIKNAALSIRTAAAVSRSKLTVSERLRNITAAVLISACLLGILQMAQFTDTCRQICSGVLRLHVIANSDSDADQALKLKVRDAILSKGSELFDGSITADNAEQKLSSKIGSLEDEANRVISENGFDYRAKVKIGEEYFPVREYENFTLPSGRYMSLTVTLGQGGGHNWWCVMFPPLCLPAAENRDEVYDAVFSSDETEIIEHRQKYKIKFKILEWTDELLEKLRS